MWKLTASIIAIVFMNMTIQPLEGSSLEIEPLPVLQSDVQENMQFQVNHHVKDGNVYIESYIPGFSFRSSSNGDNADIQNGYLIVNVDGEDVVKVQQAAFIVKGLEPGEHHIELEVFDDQDNSLGLQEAFTVTIQE